MPSYQDPQRPLGPVGQGGHGGPDPGTQGDAPARLGRYELLGKLATGGMSEIHLARLAGEAGFEKLVVVKRLLPELVASPTYVAMFLDEGKLVARLDHPNICEVHELGREGADYYLAMPYLDGVAVTDLIARPRDPDRVPQLRVAAGVIVQACAGLHHAHELRDKDGASVHLVHRDVSPSNLFATTAGLVKVLDFGIAKVRGAAATEVGMIKGKQQYMAPEQLLGDPVDRRCDVFALGIVLYELATHQRLFKRPSDYLAARAILDEPIPRADSVDPAVPRALADVIAKALERKPADRYATAHELGEAVARALPPATPDEIAAMVTSSDELTAQRTRQQRVVGDARSRGTSDGVGTDVATAQRLNATPDIDVATAQPRSADLALPPPAISDAASARGSSRLVIALGALVVVLAIAVFVLARGRDTSDEPIRPEASTVRPADHSEPSGSRPSGGSTSAVGDSTRIAAAGSAGGGSGEGSAMPAVGSARPAVGSAAPAVGAPRNPPAKPGLFSIDSTPYATIFIDGARLGITPIVKHVLPAGRHAVRAVLPDGRTKDQSIEIVAGKLAPPIKLTW